MTTKTPKLPMEALEKEKGENSREFAGRLLASMFQEVFSHTGREMPSEVFDACHDFVRETVDAVREEMREVRVTW